MVPPSAAEPHITKSNITVASLLVEVVSCTDKLAESIHELSSLAKFKNKDCKVAPQHPTSPRQKEAHQPFDCDNSGSHHISGQTNLALIRIACELRRGLEYHRFNAYNQITEISKISIQLKHNHRNIQEIRCS
ncbi:unnamed protein product [Lupinus luteus]|uniref:Aluminum-activated malate transporter n=1 Tax=Lupinus luteus TaxID=3873 RepID=A0AAV1W4R8_LUPLU